MNTFSQSTIVIRGAGDIATGVALRLWRTGFRRIAMLELTQPMSVRRTVSFSEAVYEGCFQVEEVKARLAEDPTDSLKFWEQGEIPILVDPTAASLDILRPAVLLDASLSKKNIGMHLRMAPLVLALGPGYTAGVDVHMVIETQRGHTLGRVLRAGAALPNTGIPHTTGGYNLERVLRAPQAGIFHTHCDIGRMVQAGENMGHVDGSPICAAIDGQVRGLLRDGTKVNAGTKVGDIEPRPHVDFHLVSDKALAVGGGVLEAIIGNYVLSPQS